MIEITPDWSLVRTAKRAEEEFVNFKFTGPGWYVLESSQTMLVMPLGGPLSGVWSRRWSTDQRFVFMSYSAPPFDTFAAVSQAPIRRDERKAGAA